MKKKKGFTLIELLAVIVILAIISLIATPIVLNLIDSAKKGAFERSVEGVVRSANLFYAQELVNNPNVAEITFTCNNNECTTTNILDVNGNPSKLDITGIVGNGNVILYEDGGVALTLINETYIATKEKNEEIIINKTSSIEEKKVTIIFDGNGGTVSESKKEVTVNSTYGELPVPTYTDYVFMGWYTSATNGAKIEESTLVTVTENQTLYAQWKKAHYDDNGNIITATTYVTGDDIKLGGYKWHVIGDINDKLTLLMDANQLGDKSEMAHCTADADATTDCGVNSKGDLYVYSWDKSLIRTYLNGEFLTNLESKITNEIISMPICADPTRDDGETTYGGYLMSELNVLGKTSDCSKQVSDKVRLISSSEYYNMSPYYETEDDNYPNVNHYIKPLSKTSDYESWLYCKSTNCGSSYYWGAWWTMNSSFGSDINTAHEVNVDGGGFLSIKGVGAALFSVRPVITIIK